MRPGPLLVTGAGGMLGRTLVRRLASRGVVALDRRGANLADPAATDAAIATHRPAVVVNCAAMTAVDLCETSRDEAFAGNALTAANLARACHRHGVRLLHLSTDYVFAGDLDRPYRESDTPAPRTVYGASKLAGEEAVHLLCSDHLILRTAWLYGPGGPSFVHTMLRLGAESGPPLTVVDDQIGNPTSTDAVATAIAHLIDHDVRGTLHLACTGDATWYGLAREIMTTWRPQRPVLACTTAQFPRPAPRPANSRLDTTAAHRCGIPMMPDWKAALHRFHQEFPNG